MRGHRRTVAMIGNSLGVVLSLLCLYASCYLLTKLPTLYYAGGLTLPVSMLIWGIVLLFYFVKLLLGRPQQAT